MFWLVLLFTLSVALLIFAASSLAIAVERVARGNFLREDLPAPTAELKERVARTDLWARNHGFHAAGLMRLSVYPDLVKAKPDYKPAWEYMAAWKDRSNGRILVLQSHGNKVAHHFITFYRSPNDEQAMVNTTDQPNEFFLPQPPGHYVQSFPRRSLDELLELHSQAEAWFESRRSWKRVDAPLPLEELVRLNSERFRYVVSLPYWKARLLFWHLDRQRRLNQPVARLYG